MALKKKKPALSTGDLLDQSVWAQADQFLAKALLDSDRLCARIDKAQRKAASAAMKSLAAIEGDALLVRQSVTEAATLRGLVTFGKSGDICAFDPLHHELSHSAATGTRSAAKVKIKSPGVINNASRGARVLIRAKATPVKKQRRAGK